MDDNKCNTEGLYEEGSYNKIISAYETSNETNRPPIITEHDNAPETNETNLVEIHESFINRKNNLVFFIN
jgi:hypothetical protein